MPLFFQPANLNLHMTPSMEIAIFADDGQMEMFHAKQIPKSIRLTRLNQGGPIPLADCYFDMLFEENGASFPSVHDRPVFINSVNSTSSQFSGNVIRFNGWNTFFNRDMLELVADNVQVDSIVEPIMENLGWKYQTVPDTPGMIAARVVAMIINEAYFALGDAISSKTEIDIAMKLGTNYPFGPFEWAEKIGLRKIHDLLIKLAEQDLRYVPSAALVKEIGKT